MGDVIPLVYCLLPNKTQTIYEEVIRAVKIRCPTFEPLSLMCDFEAAAIKAFQAEFPQIEVTGCLFHLVSAILPLFFKKKCYPVDFEDKSKIGDVWYDIMTQLTIIYNSFDVYHMQCNFPQKLIVYKISATQKKGGRVAKSPGFFGKKSAKKAE